MLVNNEKLKTKSPGIRHLVIKHKPPMKMFLLLAETFQALADSTRVQIIWALSHGELCVGDLEKALELPQTTVSHHLRTLRNLKLVKVRKDGRTSHYSLDDEHVEKLLREGIEHVEDLLE